MDNERSKKAWEILYGEAPEFAPDPNKPENLAYYNAKKEEKRRDFQLLMRGPGKALFEMWHKKIKTLNIQVFDTARGLDCDCASCRVLRQMDGMFQLWLEAEMVVGEKAPADTGPST